MTVLLSGHFLVLHSLNWPQTHIFLCPSTDLFPCPLGPAPSGSSSQLLPSRPPTRTSSASCRRVWLRWHCEWWNLRVRTRSWRIWRTRSRPTGKCRWLSPCCSHVSHSEKCSAWLESASSALWSPLKLIASLNSQTTIVILTYLEKLSKSTQPSNWRRERSL